MKRVNPKVIIWESVNRPASRRVGAPPRNLKVMTKT